VLSVLLPGILLVMPALLPGSSCAASATTWILFVLPPLLPKSYWCSLRYCLDPICAAPLLLGSYWRCHCYCLDPIGAATATTWYPIGAAWATAWYSIGAASAPAWILLVLASLLPGSYWCCLRYCLVSYWCCLRYCLVFYACSAALLPGIQLVLPVLVITAVPLDYRFKERNGRMHLPALKKLVNNRSKHFGLVSWNYLHLKSYAYLAPVKHLFQIL
jgi:hypothetical protein